MATKYPYGNPETQAFGKQYLRWAIHGDVKVRVHKAIWPLVNRILVGLDGMGVDITQATTVNEDPLHLSFRIPLTPEQVEGVREAVEPAKFSVTDDGVFTFTAEPEMAESLSAAIGIHAETVLPESVDDEPTEVEPVEFVQRWGRELRPGDFGEDVLFIQYLLGAEPTGVFDMQTIKHVTVFQSKRRRPETGVVDTTMWHDIFPARIGWLRPGATGQPIKVLQAAFKVIGAQNGPITGVWGVRLSHSVRLFQEANGLMKRLRVGAPEFDLLFVPRSEMGFSGESLGAQYLVDSESPLGEKADFSPVA